MDSPDTPKGEDTTTSKQERAALLKARYAGRYDSRASWAKRRATPAEAMQEQEASFVRVPPACYPALIKRGLVTPPPIRLTDAGRARLTALLAADQAGDGAHLHDWQPATTIDANDDARK
jgi:hypothetical protein